MSAIYLDEKKVLVQGQKDDPKDVKEFWICKVPAILGREIIFKYPTSLLAKVASYESGEEVMKKLMAYVRVKFPDGREVALDSDIMINNHVPGGEMLMNLEKEMLKYNFGFFKNGEAFGS